MKVLRFGSNALLVRVPGINELNHVWLQRHKSQDIIVVSRNLNILIAAKAHVLSLPLAFDLVPVTLCLC